LSFTLRISSHLSSPVENGGRDKISKMQESRPKKEKHVCPRSLGAGKHACKQSFNMMTQWQYSMLWPMWQQSLQLLRPLCGSVWIRYVSIHSINLQKLQRIGFTNDRNDNRRKEDEAAMTQKQSEFFMFNLQKGRSHRNLHAMRWQNRNRNLRTRQSRQNQTCWSRDRRIFDETTLPDLTVPGMHYLYLQSTRFMYNRAALKKNFYG